MKRQASVEKIAKVTAASVHKGTGKSWDEWIRILRQAGAEHWTYQEIVALLTKKYKLSPWWRHGVAYGYEIHIGRRVEGRSGTGLYGTVASKTLPVNQRAAWTFMTSHEGQAVWLEPMSPFVFAKGEAFEVEGGIFGEIRTLKVHQRARMTWQSEEMAKPSVISLNFIARSQGKSMVVIQHEQIPNARAKMELKEHWKMALQKVAESLKLKA